MKYIKYTLGVAVLSAGLTASLVAVAAVDDPVYLYTVDAEGLVLAQRMCFANWSVAQYGTPISAMKHVKAQRATGEQGTATLYYEVTGDLGEMIADETKVNYCGVAEDGGTYTWCSSATIDLDAAKRTALLTCINGVWGGVESDAMRYVHVGYAPAGEDWSGVNAMLKYVTTSDEATWLARYKAGTADLPFGVVAE